MRKERRKHHHNQQASGVAVVAGTDTKYTVDKQVERERDTPCSFTCFVVVATTTADDDGDGDSVYSDLGFLPVCLSVSVFHFVDIINVFDWSWSWYWCLMFDVIA